MEDPQGAREQTEARIEAAIERERRPERPLAPPVRAKFVNPPPMTAPGHFQDRHVETGLIGDFLRADGLRLMSVIGRGGVGKTAMVCRLLKGLEAGQLPDELGELAVDGIVYLSPIGARRQLPQPVRRPLPAAPPGDGRAAPGPLPGPKGDLGGLDAGAAGGLSRGKERGAAGQLRRAFDGETFEITEGDLERGCAPS